MCMPFGLIVAQFQCPRPTLYGGVISLSKLSVGALQIIEQADVIDGNRSLGGHGLEECEPSFISYELGSMKDFQHPHDLSFSYQRHSMVADEVLTRQKYTAQVVVMLLCQISYMNDFAILCGQSRIALAQGLVCFFDGSGVKTTPGNVFQRPGHGVVQQYVGCVNAQLDNDMGEKRCQTKRQVETEIDDAVNINQGGYMLKMPSDPFFRA